MTKPSNHIHPPQDVGFACAIVLVAFGVVAAALAGALFFWLDVF
jgi:hypothetical protein